MKILITGATGFIGSNFLLRLVNSKKYEIYLLFRKKNYSSQNLNKYKNVKIFYTELDDLSRLDKIFRKVKPEFIFHFAWQGVANFERNSSDQILNITYSINLAYLADKYKSFRFIGLGSQAEYGPQNKILNENSVTKPSTVYGKIKLNTFQILNEYFKNSKTNFTWLRLFSSYGPGDKDYWFLIKLIKTMLKNKKMKITKCEQIWDYIYIEDLIDVLLKMTKRKKISTLYNLGSGETIKLKEIVKFIHKETQTSVQIKFGSMPYRLDQVMKLIPNVDKIQKDFNWKPKYNIYKGLKFTIDWYKKNGY